ncbi:MAG: hypothetical protein AAFV85_11300 [Cyanobacteria bacterium J06634_6]
MSSPFASIEEFNNALDGPTGGAIYTFADKPIFNNIALLASVGIFVWFIIKTYTTHAEPSSVDNSLNRLSSFIVIGLLSLVAADYRQTNRPEQSSQMQGAQTSTLQSSRKTLPLGLLGLASVGLPTLRRSKGRKRKSKSRLKGLSRRRVSKYR